MGCSNVKSFQEWEDKMIYHEGRMLEFSGVPLNTVTREFTMIEMDGAPYKVRTFYIGKDDKTKPTLLLIHGNLA